MALSVNTNAHYLQIKGRHDWLLLTCCMYIFPFLFQVNKRQTWQKTKICQNWNKQSSKVKCKLLSLCSTKKLSICLFLPVFIFNLWHIFRNVWFHNSVQFVLAALVIFFNIKQLSYQMEWFFFVCFFSSSMPGLDQQRMRRSSGAVCSGHVTFRPQLESSRIKGQEDTELIRATEPFFCLFLMLKLKWSISGLYIMQSHMATSRDGNLRVNIVRNHGIA